jgi:hypothetical protein
MPQNESAYDSARRSDLRTNTSALLCWPRGRVLSRLPRRGRRPVRCSSGLTSGPYVPTRCDGAQLRSSVNSQLRRRSLELGDDRGAPPLKPGLATTSPAERPGRCRCRRRQGFALRENGPSGSLVCVPAGPGESTVDDRPFTLPSSPAMPRRPMNAGSPCARTRCSCRRNSVYCAPVPCRCAATAEPTTCARHAMRAGRVKSRTRRKQGPTWAAGRDSFGG